MQGANLFSVPRVPAAASKCIYAKANGTYSEIKSSWPEHLTDDGVESAEKLLRCEKYIFQWQLMQKLCGICMGKSASGKCNILPQYFGGVFVNYGKIKQEFDFL